MFLWHVGSLRHIVMFLFDRSDFPEKRTIRENSLDPGIIIPWAPGRDSHRPEMLWGMLGSCWDMTIVLGHPGAADAEQYGADPVRARGAVGNSRKPLISIDFDENH